MSSGVTTVRLPGRRAHVELALWSALVALVTADAVATTIALWAGAPEANPMVRAVIHAGGVPALLVLKALQVVVLVAIWRAIDIRGRVVALGCAAAAQAGIVGIVLYRIGGAAA